MSASWAAVLGGCGSRVSGEHAISRSQYGGSDSITVQGFECALEALRLLEEELGIDLAEILG